MRGTISKWTDRGFGFIRPDGGGRGVPEIFVHVRDIRNLGDDMPEEGQTVDYQIGHDKDDRQKAILVTIEG